MGKKKKHQKRGYPVGIIIGFEPMYTIIWKVFSERAVQYRVVKLGRKFKNANKSHLYHFYEENIDHLRILLKEGLRSILLVTPPKTNYSTGFMKHIESHHKWMLKYSNSNSISNFNSPSNSANFQMLTGNVGNNERINYFMQSDEYKNAIGETTSNEADQLINILEKRLNDIEEGFVLHSLKEIEDLVYSGGKRKKKFKPLKLNPEYILLTNQYLDENPQKNRIQRLIQICKNREINTKIIDIETPAGERIMQLGGIVCFLQTKSEYEKIEGNKIINS
ncbi:MAG: hypothetical protein GY870_07180 [archaeon]|nr:hypothetical protein [archaeon]